MYSALSTSIPRRGALEEGTVPQLLPGHRSINGCPLVRVCVHGVCVQLDEFWKILRLSGFHCFLNICMAVFKYFIWNLSFFQFRSALLQACLRERMLSLSHGSVLGFDFLGLRGAVVFKTSEQAVLNRLRCCSASMSGKNDPRDRDKHTLLKVFVKSS